MHGSLRTDAQHLGQSPEYGSSVPWARVGTKAVAVLSLLCAIIFAQAGSLRLFNPRPDIAAMVATIILLTTAPSHGGAITIGTTNLGCQLYVAIYIATCTAAHAICHSFRRFEQIEWHLRQQFTARAIAATLVATALLVASVEIHRHTGCQLAAISIAVPQPASCYTVMISLTITSLPSITLKPASMARHQLNESWDESWSIMALGRRTMASGEADSRAIRRLIKAKRTPDDLRKACREM